MSSWQPFAEHLRQSIILAQEEVCASAAAASVRNIFCLESSARVRVLRRSCFWSGASGSRRRAKPRPRSGSILHRPSVPANSALPRTQAADRAVFRRRARSGARLRRHRAYARRNDASACGRCPHGHRERRRGEAVPGVRASRVGCGRKCVVGAAQRASSRCPQGRCAFRASGCRRPENSEVALYTECLRIASGALGPGTPVETVRETAKVLFEHALADIAAVQRQGAPGEG